MRPSLGIVKGCLRRGFDFIALKINGNFVRARKRNAFDSDRPVQGIWKRIAGIARVRTAVGSAPRVSMAS
jgi:hypothetical protein